jgi:heat shock protein HslJ
MTDALHDTSWILAGPIHTPDGVDVVVAFADGNVSGFSGCNRFRGTYQLHDEALAFGPLAGTMMACMEEAMAVEREVLQRFGAAANIGLLDGRLQLLDADRAVLLEFEAVTADAVQGEWVVDGIHYPERAAIISVRGHLTVAIAADTVSGSGGCNQFRGGFVVTDEGVTIGPLISTRRFCDDDAAGSGPSIMEQEAALFAALEAAAGYRLEGGRLTFTRRDGGISVSLHRA